jgi:DNA repair ATPase RecN
MFEWLSHWQSGESMAKVYEHLVRANTELKKSKEAASSNKAIAELKEWQISKLPEFEFESNQYTRMGSVGRLPETGASAMSITI